MDTPEKISQVENQILNRIEYCIKEYNLTLAETLGILESIKMSMFMQKYEEDDD